VDRRLAICFHFYLIPFFLSWILWISCRMMNFFAPQQMKYKEISCFSVLEQLPRSNVTLLSHFLCILHHIARRAAHNLMSAANLGVCVGPSLLWAHTPTPASSRAVPNLVELLVVRCELLLGPHVPLLLGDPPERDMTRQDSGAEESDSLHCESQCLFIEFQFISWVC
jgi:hypothetical protein